MDLIIQNAFRLAIRNVRFNLSLLIHISINTIKKYTTIHFRLKKTNVLEDLILFITYLIRYVFQTKQKIEIYKCRYDGRKCNSDQWQNNNTYRCECKRRHVCQKSYVWNPSTCNGENGKYLASIMDNSMITCHEVIEPYEGEKNFNETKETCKMQNIYILITFFINYYSIIDSC